MAEAEEQEAVAPEEAAEASSLEEGSAQPDLSAEVERLAAEVAARQEENLRLRADFENYRRRMQREQEALAQRVTAGLIGRFLPVLDNLKRAADAAEEAGSLEAVREGVRLVLRQMEELLRREGVEPIAAVGQRFDPSCHEALVREEREDVDEGTVLEELQVGYRLGEAVLRPALVKVAVRAEGSRPVDGEASPPS